MTFKTKKLKKKSYIRVNTRELDRALSTKCLPVRHSLHLII